MKSYPEILNQFFSALYAEGYELPTRILWPKATITRLLDEARDNRHFPSAESEPYIKDLIYQYRNHQIGLTEDNNNG